MVEQREKIGIAAEEDYLVELVAHHRRVDGDFDVEISFLPEDRVPLLICNDSAESVLQDDPFESLLPDIETQPFGQIGGEVVNSRVIVPRSPRSDFGVGEIYAAVRQLSIQHALKIRNELFEIHVPSDGMGARPEIRKINEQRQSGHMGRRVTG